VSVEFKKLRIYVACGLAAVIIVASITYLALREKRMQSRSTGLAGDSSHAGASGPQNSSEISSSAPERQGQSHTTTQLTSAGSGMGLLNDTSGEVKATLPLFHQVGPDYLRGSEPAKGGVELLARAGVKTIVDLRSKYEHTDSIQTIAEEFGLRYYWAPMGTWDPPSDQDTAKFLELVLDHENSPVFVFCADGINRTGEMTAIYRIVHDHWSADQALKEMDDLGFSPYYYSLRTYVWTYAREHKPRPSKATS
jgi:protein tyrosine phosphatase (PTP) superfamily phosphohydrolase (DUF442 family)